MNKIEQIQKLLGVKVDGIWGPKSQLALIRATYKTKTEIQGILGVTQDGMWGPVSQAALNEATGGAQAQGWRDTKFTSFADPADVVAFKKCKTTGKTDVQCFAVGDNGIGQFGKITAQEHTPMVAIHGEEMEARWGSRAAAAHRPVELEYQGKIIQATCEDRISARGKVDLNPACAKMLGLKPPFVVNGRWRWV